MLILISLCSPLYRPNGHSGGEASPVLKNQHAWESDKNEKDSSSHGDSSSNSESVFANPNTDSAVKKTRASNAPNRRWKVNYETVWA